MSRGIKPRYIPGPKTSARLRRIRGQKWGKIGAPKSAKRKAWLKHIRPKTKKTAR